MQSTQHKQPILMKCFLLIRETSMYTESPLLIGVFGFFHAARRIANVQDTHRYQAYMRDDDPVQMRIQELAVQSGGSEVLVVEDIYLVITACHAMGQCTQRICSAHATYERAVASASRLLDSRPAHVEYVLVAHRQLGAWSKEPVDLLPSSDPCTVSAHSCKVFRVWYGETVCVCAHVQHGDPGPCFTASLGER
jgi:hypothetical protein